MVRTTTMDKNSAFSFVVTARSGEDSGCHKFKINAYRLAFELTVAAIQAGGIRAVGGCPIRQIGEIVYILDSSRVMSYIHLVLNMS